MKDFLNDEDVTALSNELIMKISTFSETEIQSALNKYQKIELGSFMKLLMVIMSQTTYNHLKTLQKVIDQADPNGENITTLTLFELLSTSLKMQIKSDLEKEQEVNE